MRYFIAIFTLFLSAANMHAVGLSEASWCRLGGVEAVGNRIWCAVQTGTEFLPPLCFACDVEPVQGSLLVGHSDDMGRTWIWKESDSCNVEKAVLWLSPKKELICFYSKANQTYMISCASPADAEPAWSSPVLVASGLVSSRPVVLDDGRCALVADEGECQVYVSSDEGASWQKYGMPVSAVRKLDFEAFPSLFVRTDGGLSMSVHSAGYGWTKIYDSQDLGQTWDEARMMVTMPALDYSLTVPAKGRMLLVKNSPFDFVSYKMPLGLFSFISDDDGVSWYGNLRVDGTEEAMNPDVALLDDDRILIAYEKRAKDSSQVCFLTTSLEEIDSCGMDPDKIVRTSDVAFMAAKTVEAYERILPKPRKKFAKKSLRVSTFNIQNDFDNKVWKSQRLKALKGTFDEYDFDLVGSQEPYISQIRDVIRVTGDRYGWIGCNIDGGVSEDRRSINPIFYKKSRLELIEWDRFIFSEEPESPGYGAAARRFCIWAKFKDKETGIEFYIFNSHFDHIGAEAKQAAANILVERSREIARDYPVFYTGDFNSIKGCRGTRDMVGSGFIGDSRYAVKEPVNAQYYSQGKYRPVNTVSKSGVHLDHVYYTPATVRPKYWEMIMKDYDGCFPSDHFPIVVDVNMAY